MNLRKNLTEAHGRMSDLRGLSYYDLCLFLTCFQKGKKRGARELERLALKMPLDLLSRAVSKLVTQGQHKLNPGCGPGSFCSLGDILRGLWTSALKCDFLFPGESPFTTEDFSLGARAPSWSMPARTALAVTSFGL